jgi:hypothetical protein
MIKLSTTLKNENHKGINEKLTNRLIGGRRN